MVPPITDGKLKVLIVEDNDDTAGLERDVLQKVGFRIERVADGGQAIAEMKRFRPNIVVLDLELPNKTGDQIQEEMMKDAELRDTPVIVASVHMTDSTDPENLGNKYNWIHHRFTGSMSKRIVRKVSSSSTIKDLLIEVTIACGEAYSVQPLALRDYWAKADPKNVPPFEVLMP